MAKRVDFRVMGEAYVGYKEETKKPYIQLHLDEELASRISYMDLCSKIFLFRSDKGAGQYTLMAPVRKDTNEV